MVTPVTGRASEIQFEDDPRRLPDKIPELEKEVGFVFFFFVNSLISGSLVYFLYLVSCNNNLGRLKVSYVCNARGTMCLC